MFYKVVAYERWSLTRGGRYERVDSINGILIHGIVHYRTKLFAQSFSMCYFTFMENKFTSTALYMHQSPTCKLKKHFIRKIEAMYPRPNEVALMKSNSKSKSKKSFICRQIYMHNLLLDISTN